MEHQASAHQDEHPPTTIRQYVIIGVILAVITLIELWLSYSGLAHGVMVTGLLFFSALKFIIVVALFMHLRFDKPLFTRLFVFGFFLAAALLVSWVALFDYDIGPRRTVVAAAPTAEAPGGHGEEGGEGAAGEGEGEGGAAAGDPDGTVKDLPVAEFFAANCAACHGQNREGLVGPALTPDALTQDDQFYFDTIADGRPGTAMPSWSAAGLTNDDIANLVAYITTVEP